MFKEYSKLKNKSNSLLKQLDELKFEKESLYEQINYLSIVCDSLNFENFELVDQFDCLVASQYDVPYEFSVKLDKLLSFQKPYENRCGLGFESEASTSKNPPSFQGKLLFVPPTIEEEPSSSLSPRKLEKGNYVLEYEGSKSLDRRKKVRSPLKPKVKGVNSPRRQPCSHPCYHCGKVDHICAQCYHLIRSRQPKRETLA